MEFTTCFTYDGYCNKHLLEAFGLWGLIVAPALAAAIEVLIGQVYQAYATRRNTAVQLADLEARYRELAQKVAQSENGEVTPELHNLTKRLADMLADSRDVSQSGS